MTFFEKLESAVDLKCPPSKFYEIFHSKPFLLPTISQEKIQLCELQEGDWGKDGSLLYWNYVHDGKVYMTRDVIEAVDEENYAITLTTIEGDLLEQYKTFKTTLKAFPKGEGTVARWTFECEKLQEQDPYLEIFLQYHMDLSKEIDAYLIENGQKLAEQAPVQVTQA